MAEVTNWQPISTAPEGVEVLTRILDKDGERNVQTLRRSGRLFFVPSGDMYVYYTPTHWAHVERKAGSETMTTDAKAIEPVPLTSWTTEESLLEAGYVPAERVRAWDQQAIVTALLASPELRMSTMLAMPDKSLAVEERRQREAAETRARDAETHLTKIAQLAEATGKLVLGVPSRLPYPDALRNNAGYLLAAVAAWRVGQAKVDSGPMTNQGEEPCGDLGKSPGSGIPSKPSITEHDGGAEKVTHQQAQESLQRFIDCAFCGNQGERPRFSIPVRVDRDDDVLLSRYITQQEQTERELREQLALVERGSTATQLGYAIEPARRPGRDVPVEPIGTRAEFMRFAESVGTPEVSVLATREAPAEAAAWVPAVGARVVVTGRADSDSPSLGPRVEETIKAIKQRCTNVLAMIKPFAHDVICSETAIFLMNGEPRCQQCAHDWLDELDGDRVHSVQFVGQGEREAEP